MMSLNEKKPEKPEMGFTTPEKLTRQQNEINRLQAVMAEKVREKKKLQKVRDDAVEAARTTYASARDRADGDYKTAVADIDTNIDDIQAKLDGITALDTEK